MKPMVIIFLIIIFVVLVIIITFSSIGALRDGFRFKKTKKTDVDKYYDFHKLNEYALRESNANHPSKQKNKARR